MATASTPKQSENYKNDITQVYELAKKHNLRVVFTDIDAVGRAPYTVYTVRITVGEITADAKARNKKEAKAKSSSIVLKQLRSLPPPPPRPERLHTVSKQKKPPSGPGSTQVFKETNPCNCLSEEAKARRIRYPVYTDIGSRRMRCGWIHTISVTMEGQTTVGTGPSKKAAKNNAAAEMLKLMGFSAPCYNPLINQQDVKPLQVDQVQFVDTVDEADVQQLPPEVLPALGQNELTQDQKTTSVEPETPTPPPTQEALTTTEESTEAETEGPIKETSSEEPEVIQAEPVDLGEEEVIIEETEAETPQVDVSVLPPEQMELMWVIKDWEIQEVESSTDSPIEVFTAYTDVKVDSTGDVETDGEETTTSAAPTNAEESLEPETTSEDPEKLQSGPDNLTPCETLSDQVEVFIEGETSQNDEGETLISAAPTNAEESLDPETTSEDPENLQAGPDNLTPSGTSSDQVEVFIEGETSQDDEEETFISAAPTNTEESLEPETTSEGLVELQAGPDNFTPCETSSDQVEVFIERETFQNDEGETLISAAPTNAEESLEPKTTSEGLVELQAGPDNFTPCETSSGREELIIEGETSQDDEEETFISAAPTNAEESLEPESTRVGPEERDGAEGEERTSSDCSTTSQMEAITADTSTDPEPEISADTVKAKRSRVDISCLAPDVMETLVKYGVIIDGALYKRQTKMDRPKAVSTEMSTGDTTDTSVEPDPFTPAQATEEELSTWVDGTEPTSVSPNDIQSGPLTSIATEPVTTTRHVSTPAHSFLGETELPSPPKIFEEPPVACLIIRALVKKLMKKTSWFKNYNNMEVVTLLEETNKERISVDSNITISVDRMKEVGKAAAKDLIRDYKNQGAPKTPEDAVFQEAVCRHINSRLNNVIENPKKNALARFTSAVSRGFC